MECDHKRYEWLGHSNGKFPCKVLSKLVDKSHGTKLRCLPFTVYLWILVGKKFNHILGPKNSNRDNLCDDYAVVKGA